MIGDLPQHIMHILRPYPVKYLAADVIAEPVTAGDPYGIAIFVNDLSVVVDMQLVIVVAVRLCGSLCCERNCRCGCSGQHCPCQNRWQQHLLKNVMQHKILPVSCVRRMIPHLISVLPIL